MGLTRQDILNYAQRYISAEEIVDFPLENELFYFLMRNVDHEGKKADKWSFGGYGICIEYTLDEEEKIIGKWLWFHYVSLLHFPPVKSVLRLQPPHVAKGQFQSHDRSVEIKIVKVDVRQQVLEEKNREEPHTATAKILKFPIKNDDSTLTDV